MKPTHKGHRFPARPPCSWAYGGAEDRPVCFNSSSDCSAPEFREHLDHKQMAESGLRSGAIVTGSESATIQDEAGTIDVLPAWRFLLRLPESVDEAVPGGA